ncbi:MAG: ABC transporter permease [Propionibacteriaceae bacterium]|nr:ABC transporter permease [Propionibacteriaceae bacterium]
MNTWSLSWHGVATVVGLETRQRLRSKKWLWGLLGWFVFIGSITGLVIWAVYTSYSSISCVDSVSCSIADSNAGPWAFSFITLFVLGMGLVIAPAFTATSINGDRTQGTLATLQATRLSSAEIVAGKLIAACATAAVFLVVALPFVVVSMVLGNISVVQVLVCFLVTLLLVAVVCAIGLGWSSVFTRASASTLMTYLTTLILAVISPIILVASTPFLGEERPVQVWGLSQSQWYAYNQLMDDYWADDGGGKDVSGAPLPPVDKCQWNTRTERVVRMDKVWWLLVPNPFVTVADAAPLPPNYSRDQAQDGLAMIRQAVREVARAPQDEVDECAQLYGWNPAFRTETDAFGVVHVTTNDGTPVNIPPSPVKPRPMVAQDPVWPWGLGVNLLIGAGFFWLAVSRLRIPYHTLAKGTRVA